MRIDKMKVAIEMVKQSLTQGMLAEKSGMSRGNLSTILNGRSCQEVTAIKIANGLGVNVTEIIKEA